MSTAMSTAPTPTAIATSTVATATTAAATVTTSTRTTATINHQTVTDDVIERCACCHVFSPHLFILSHAHDYRRFDKAESNTAAPLALC